MKIPIKELIQQNNEKRELLLPENKKYYEDLLVYIRANLSKDERAVEEVLLEMLDHLLEAQKEGKTAETVFGKNPKELADEILAALPKESWKHQMEFALEILFTFFGWYFAIVGLFPLFKKEDQTVYAGTLIVSGILLVGAIVMFIYIVLKILKNGTFREQKKRKGITILYSIIAGGLFALGLIVKFAVPPFGPTFEVSYYTVFGMGCFLLLASYLLKKMREQNA
ncbi:DUF1129 family protein [Ureibacillus sp. FSL K6-8385]|uniref:DUF1129 domain-containing protein n=1 Tax=Ureibacillus terrenus TaxID=118246 RepID=A0A540V6Q6_9BACL|nr:DUF1129 family protein [Ureibacillus terrenus]MED3660605.1 DUF1129 family protein [Ureibacillus terrenus]MED3762725.1 DUF1129 family protein [Ureibacillus terrenus]TQE92401.1 DUF1129 domain-containing protein [Ureibacillus terrenus]